MKSAVVNARIPLAKKEAAARLLEAIGSTPSELINSAYDYLLKFGKLPDASSLNLKAQNGRSFEDFVALTTHEVDWDVAGIPLDYKEYVREGKRRDYESLA